VTAVRPEFEPTLPALLRRRAGVPERVTVALLVLALALVAVAALLVRPRVDGVRTLVHRSEPVFNLEYDTGALHEVAPRPGELARLEGQRGRQSVSITAWPLELPAYEGDVAHGLLPVYASGHIRGLAGDRDRFRLTEQHRARINEAPGYEIRFLSGPAARPTLGTDTLLLPDEEESRGAVLLSMRRTVDGRLRLNEREKEFADRASEAFRSFSYGTGRP
jgi:hypothetical protein